MDMNDDWDDDDFVPPPPSIVTEAPKGQWDDEDKEEEEVKESWDKEEKAAAPGAAAKPKPGKKEKKKKEAEKAVESEVLDDPIAEKLRQRRLVEESDFRAAEELFALKTKGEGEKASEEFIPKIEAEFLEYAAIVSAKVTAFSKSFHYMTLLKELVRQATPSLSAAETKELSQAVGVMANEKLKAEKEAEKGKKKAATKKQPAKLKMESHDDFDSRGVVADSGPDDYDFM